MSGSAMRATAVRKEATTQARNAPKRPHLRRRGCSRFKKTIRCAFVLGALVSVFGYIGIYANVTAASYDRSRLTSELRMEKIRNERLRVELIRLSSPAYAISAAQQSGMVYPKEYDYLRKPQAVASVQ